VNGSVIGFAGSGTFNLQASGSIHNGTADHVRLGYAEAWVYDSAGRRGSVAVTVVDDTGNALVSAIEPGATVRWVASGPAIIQQPDGTPGNVPVRVEPMENTFDDFDVVRLGHPACVFSASDG
jgi:hypothetical protein